MLALAIGLVALLLAGGAALFAALGSRSTPAPSPPSHARPTPPAPPALAPAKEPDPPPAPVLRVLGDTPTLFADVDGDQRADPIAPISLTLGTQRTEHYAIFDGRWVTAFGTEDGVRRWTREVPGEGSGGLDTLGAAADRVFVVAKGSLLLLDAATGELEAVAGGATAGHEAPAPQ